MRRSTIAVVLMALMAMPYGATALAANEIEQGNSSQADNTPQPVVVCSGWHALSDFATNCEVVGDQANCACWKVKETYMVESSKIQDKAVKKVTRLSVLSPIIAI